MDQEDIIKRLVALTGGPVDYFSKLYVLQDENDDLELYIEQARRENKISQDTANIANLSLMTGLDPARCASMLAGSHNLLRALDAARKDEDIGQQQATCCRLAVATGKTSAKARKYPLETIPPFNFRQAIKYLEDAEEITSEESTVATLRFVTSLGLKAVTRYLKHTTVQGNIIKAINFARQQQHLTHQDYFVAHLMYRFGKSEIEAEAMGVRRNISWDLEKRVHATKIAIIMEQAIVDAPDATKYLDKCRGDVNQALQVAQVEAQGKKFVFDGDSGDTRHPPNVTADTHVIAVLGVADGDTQNRASPAEDGWMVSDFYLWKHVLRGMGKSQQWITCEEPSKLLKKYGTSDKQVKTKDTGIGGNSEEQISWKEGYVHGDPFEERVVVLDKSLLSAAQQNLTITAPGTTLRDEFLRRVEMTCNKAQDRNDPVLLMVFCHGDVDRAELGGLVIGIDPDPQDANDFLTPRLFAETYMKTPKIRMSLFMSSCFSGHWVVTPRFHIRRPTIMAGARPKEETFAWGFGASQRHAGGVYTSAFVKELLQEPSGIPAGADANVIRSFADLTRDIMAEANRLCIPARLETAGGSLPLFTSEGGSDRFYERTHLQLHTYRHNYEQLPRIAASDPHPFMDKKRDVQPNDQEVKAWEKRHPEVSLPEYSDRTGGYGTTRRGIRRSTYFLAHRYMSSLPGDNSMAKNIQLHNMIRRFNAGILDNDMTAIEELRRHLLYRLWMLQRANQYAEALNLNKLPPIEQWDGRVTDDRQMEKRYDTNWTIIQEANIFTRPDAGTGWGQFYSKPMRYLAYSFALSGYEGEEVKKLLSIMQNAIKASTSMKVRTFMGSKRSAGSISILRDIVQPKSPRKRHRSSLASTGWMEGGQRKEY
ncbi:MAG: hypothetical protein LQ343_005136 [Gyalolechia ehrenbergii]|nr:MAG: hypothetical protein LQ343_005136 [Gyalolechia ehrenbergii]